MIGRTEEVLISEKVKDGQLIGRTRNFKEIHLSPVGADLCVCHHNPVKIGDLVTVKITGMDRWVLKGEIL